MLCQVGVPAAVALLAALTAALSTNDCRDRFHCFNQIYPECNNTASPLVNVSIRGRPDTDVDIDGFSQVLAGLVCHHLDTSTPPSLCVYLTNRSMSYGDCNSTLSEVGVLELLGGGAVRPALTREALGTLIQSSQAFFTLAGFHVNVTDEGSSSNAAGENSLFDVPLSSWICVGLGLLFSFIFLAKPVWWDKMIIKCWHKYRTQSH